MCTPTFALMGANLAMSGVQALGQISAGNAAAAGHKENAYQYEIKRIEMRTSTMETGRDRFERFMEAYSTNVVAAGVSGLTIDSFDSVFTENRRKAGQDVDRIYAQGDIEDSRLRYAAASERTQARGAKRAGYIGAAFTLGKAALGAALNMPGGSGIAESIKGTINKSLVRLG